MISISVMSWSELPGSGLLDTSKAKLTTVVGERLTEIEEALGKVVKESIESGAVRITMMVNTWEQQ